MHRRATWSVSRWRRPARCARHERLLQQRLRRPSLRRTTTSTLVVARTLACTKSLITAGAESSSSVGSVSAVNGFGCSGSWAYADVTVGSGAASFDAVIVLEAQGSSWSVADRANACNNHLVPSAIYTQACTTS